MMVIVMDELLTHHHSMHMCRSDSGFSEVRWSSSTGSLLLQIPGLPGKPFRRNTSSATYNNA